MNALFHGLLRILGRLTQYLSEIEKPRFFVRFLIHLYVMIYRVDLNELNQSLGQFRSLQAFFTRSLDFSKRTFPEDGPIHPVDGQIIDFGPVSEDSQIRVKGCALSLSDLMDERDGRRFIGGHFLAYYLSPRDYHRVHYPLAGKRLSRKKYPGTLLPVNNMGFSLFKNVLVRNARVTSVFQTPEGGFFSLTMVAALNVGDILISDDVDVVRGGELGCFRFGSAVILIFGPDDVAVTQYSQLGPVRFGQPLCSWQKSF